MITDLEKTFFDTFGIQYEFCSDICLNPCKFQCDDCEFRTEIYPQISDRILLELICILNPFCYPSGQNIQHLKESVLDWCITFKDDIEKQVQALFREEKWHLKD